MADIANTMYSFDEDGILRLQKDLNYMFQHLDEKNVKRLYTEYCEIQSQNGELKIDGPLIEMYDGAGTLRLKEGYDKLSSEFIFNLYNDLGEPTISLDSVGDAVFSGKIQTPKDAYVGEHFYVGANSSDIPFSMSTNTRGIFIIKPGTTEYLGHIYSTHPAGSDWEFEIESSAAFNITAENTMRIYMYSGSHNIPNSSDFIDMYSWSNKFYIQSGPSGDEGLFLGDGYKNTYLYAFADSTSRVATEGFVRNRKLEEDWRYFAGRNTRSIYTINALSLVPSSTTLSNTTNSTNGIIQSSPAKIKSVTATTSQYIMAGMNITSVDLTSFNDNSAATSDDFIVFIFYLDSTAICDSTWGLFCQIGQDASTCYTYKNNSAYGYPISTGWNIISRKIGSYDAVGGSPNMNDIKYIRWGLHTAIASSGLGFCPDYVGIHRKSAVDSNTWNDFQFYKNSTYDQVYDEYGDKFMITDYSSSIYLTDISPTGTDDTLYLDNNLYRNFTLETEFLCGRDGNTPCFVWADSSGYENRIAIYATSNVLYLDVYRNSTRTQYSQTLQTLYRNDRVKWKIDKDYDGNVKVVHSVNEVVRTVRSLYWQTPFANNFGYIRLGSETTDGIFRMSKLNYTHFNG